MRIVEFSRRTLELLLSPIIFLNLLCMMHKLKKVYSGNKFIATWKFSYRKEKLLFLWKLLVQAVSGDYVAITVFCRFSLVNSIVEKILRSFIQSFLWQYLCWELCLQWKHLIESCIVHKRRQTCQTSKPRQMNDSLSIGRSRKSFVVRKFDIPHDVFTE